MKHHNILGKLNLIIFCLITFTTFTVQAKTNDEVYVKSEIDRYKNVIVQKLTEKLRADLSNNNVEVKLNSVQDSGIAKSRIEFDGKALAVVKNDVTELPLQFTAQINTSNRSVEDISYKFVEAESEFAPSLAEDNLMLELMTQISKDHKTTNITISIDKFDSARNSANQMQYQGVGEVRIGDFEWRRIEFNVTVNAQNQAAEKVLYNLQK